MRKQLNVYIRLLAAVFFFLGAVFVLPRTLLTADAASGSTQKASGTSVQKTSAAEKDASEKDTKKASAASKSKKKQSKKTKKYIHQWVVKDGYTYYYNRKGKKATGLKQLGERTYLFDKKGRQKIGWQKIGKAYYYFRNRPGKGGYMARGTTVNHITLRKNGKAVVNSATRMYCLMTSARIVEAVTRPAWGKYTKMRVVWNYFQSHFIYNGDPSFSLSGDWGARYAYNCFVARRASCEGLGFAWAFLANACGASNCVCVCSGGHGWAEVEGAVYDPSWAKVDTRYSYYRMSKSLSGYNRIPNYAAYGCYRSSV